MWHLLTQDVIRIRGKANEPCGSVGAASVGIRSTVKGRAARHAADGFILAAWMPPSIFC